MGNRVRWGVLSTAKIAQDQLLPAFLKAGNATVTAIASANEQVTAVAERFGIPKIHSTYEALLADQEIDAVYIPLPNQLHRKWVEKAARKGKHVLCEKPAALTAQDTQEMIEVCNESGVIFLEAFMYQFHPQHERVKEIIASGEIGEVKSMRASFSFLLKEIESNIRVQQSLGGGSLYDVGCYCLHSIYNILDAKIEEVFASARLHPKYQVDMSVEGIVKLNNGVTALFDASMEKTTRHHYEIIGTKGKIDVPRAFMPQLFDDNGLIIVSKDDGSVREEKIFGEQYKLQIETISKWILDGENRDSSNRYAQQSINNMQSIEACFQSIETGSFVNVTSCQESKSFRFA